MENMLTTELLYDALVNDEDVINRNIQDAIDNDLDFSAVTAKNVRHFLKELNDIRYIETALAMSNGFESNEELSNLKELLQSENKNDVLESVKNDDNFTLMLSSFSAVSKVLDKALKELENDEKDGHSFDPETNTFSGNHAAFAFVVGSINQAEKNAESFKQHPDVLKNKEVLALASFIKKIETAKNFSADKFMDGFIDYFADKDKFIKDNPFKFDKTTDVTKSLIADKLIDDIIDKDNKKDKKEKSVSKSSKKAVKSKGKSKTKESNKVKEKDIPLQKEEPKVESTVKPSEVLESKVQPEPKEPFRVFAHPAGTKKLKDENDKTIGFIIPGYKDAKGNSYDVHIPFKGNPGIVEVGKIYAFPKDDPLYNFVVTKLKPDAKLKGVGKNGEISISAYSYKNFIRNRNRVIKQNLKKKKEANRDMNISR